MGGSAEGVGELDEGRLGFLFRTSDAISPRATPSHAPAASAPDWGPLASRSIHARCKEGRADCSPSIPPRNFSRSPAVDPAAQSLSFRRGMVPAKWRVSPTEPIHPHDHEERRNPNGQGGAHRRQAPQSPEGGAESRVPERRFRRGGGPDSAPDGRARIPGAAPPRSRERPLSSPAGIRASVGRWPSFLPGRARTWRSCI